MSRILFAYERPLTTVTIMREMFSNVPESVDNRLQTSFKSIREITKEDIDSHDVLFLIRPSDYLSYKIAGKARKAGCFVIVHIDDDLLNPPQDYLSIPWRKYYLKKTLNQAHIVCSSTRSIADKYRSLVPGSRQALLNTFVTQQEMKTIHSDAHVHKDNAVKIVYAANRSHRVLFEKFLLPVLPLLYDEYGDCISFTFVGLKPQLGEFESKFKVDFVESMPLLEYRKYMAEGDFDIGIAPLGDDAFSRCKYFNKYIEYTTAGIMGVYSKCEPYTLVVENGENGLLAENTKEGWFQALRTAIDHPSFRTACVIRAQENLLRNFSPAGVLQALMEDIPELTAHETQRIKSKELWTDGAIYSAMRMFDIAYIVLYTLVKSGISGLFFKFTSHFRERKNMVIRGGNNP
ncbi:MAG: hypothetical protein ACOX55_09005 [Christensenellales bacterium]|jgi:hypothetical protein